MVLRHLLARFANETYGLQRAVGFVVAIIAFAVGLINTIIFRQVHGAGILEAIFDAYSMVVFLTSIVAFLSALWISKVGQWLQVGIFLTTGLIAAASAHSGDLTSSVFVLFGLMLIYQYNLGKKAALAASVFLIIPYPLALISSLRAFSNSYIIHTLEIFLGIICLILLYGLVLLKHELRHQQDKALLETRVRERTAELERTMKELEKANAEGVVMLQEIHHRVKNNLQIIISMLRLEADNQAIGDRSSCVDTSIQRIYAMALVHETLYGADSLDGLDLVIYAKALIEAARDPRSPGFLLNAESPIPVDLDFAVPFGLLLNELIALATTEGGLGGSSAVVFRIEEGQGIFLIVRGGGEDREKALEAELRGPVHRGFAHVLVQQLRGRLESLPGAADGLRLRFPPIADKP